MALTRDERGQAVIEYILLLAVVVSAFAIISSWVGRFGLMRKLAKPITTDFAATYQFGDPKAKGFDDDKPTHHPRAVGCEECFRIFINPRL